MSGRPSARPSRPRPPPAGRSGRCARRGAPGGRALPAALGDVDRLGRADREVHRQRPVALAGDGEDAALERPEPDRTVRRHRPGLVEGVRGAQGGVPAECDLHNGREPAQLEIGAVVDDGTDERRLRVLHLGGDALHPVRVGGVPQQAHAGRVAGERAVGEGVDDEHPHAADATGRSVPEAWPITGYWPALMTTPSHAEKPPYQDHQYRRTLAGEGVRPAAPRNAGVRSVTERLALFPSALCCSRGCCCPCTCSRTATAYWSATCWSGPSRAGSASSASNSATRSARAPRTGSPRSAASPNCAR